ncbi:MAG: glutathione S-transferase family protein [Leptolyngbyaceae cyanobacterium bins.349]|nr:glutathione S-transferase family protein [Leptolyngbyaceae cyanobacterium bins.349]
MLKLYYARPSLFARPVWLALLEKQLPFELIPVNLNGEQFEPDFLRLNPFAHIPVLVDDDFRVIESLAILDYLEAKYPQPALLPTEPAALARVRMVQLVALNELLPEIAKLIMHPQTDTEHEYAQVRALNTLNFLADTLGDRAYFANDQVTLAEIVAGTLIPALPDLGMSLTPYPGLAAWSERLLSRPTWQAIELSHTEWNQFQRQLRVLPRLWQRRRQQRLNALTLG